MNYIIESFFVGIYCCTIYAIFSPFIKNFYLLLLVCGFFKHFLGSSFGLWTWYCNNGSQCIKTLPQTTYYEANTLYLIPDSIYESILFLFFGTILHQVITNSLYLFFILGFALHIIGEHTRIHKIFCKKTCSQIE